MGSKYLDIGLAIFMGFFAYTRFMNEQYGFAALFAVLCLMNIFVAFMKHRKMNEETEDKGL